MEVVIPVNLRRLRTIGSKDIVKQFLDKHIEQAEVQVEATGRKRDNVYSALKIYLQTHPEFGTSVAYIGGKIVLQRDPNAAQKTG